MSKSRDTQNSKKSDGEGFTYTGNSLLLQLGGGLIAAGYNQTTNEKMVDDHSSIPGQHRESLHCRQESVKRVITDTYGQQVAETIQGQNNFQANLSQQVTPTVIEPFEQWPRSHDVLSKTASGEITHSMRKRLDDINHRHIGQKFYAAGQYSGFLLHGIGSMQAIAIGKLDEVRNGRMTQEQHADVEFAHLVSQNLCSGYRKQTEAEIRKERNQAALDEFDAMVRQNTCLGTRPK